MQKARKRRTPKGASPSRVKEGAGAVYMTAGAEWGFIPGTLRELGALDVEPTDFPRILGADRRTVYHWAAGKGLSRFRHFERVRAVREILDLAKQAHGERWSEWFRAPNPHIGNLAPATLLWGDKTGLELIRSLLHGALMGGVA